MEPYQLHVTIGSIASRPHLLFKRRGTKIQFSNCQPMVNHTGSCLLSTMEMEKWSNMVPSLKQRISAAHIP